MDNETWILEAGDGVIQKKTRHGVSALTPWEKLVYCLWVADYGMRNAGDLVTASDLYSDFQPEGRRLAEELALPLTLEAFAMEATELEQEYFDRFESVCDELRSAPSATREKRR